MFNTHSQRGATLIETIVYVVLLAAFSIVAINALVIMTRAFTETRTNRDLLDAGNSAMERMTREIRDASAINSGSSTFGSSPGSLSVTSVDADDVSHTISFSVSGSGISLVEDGTTLGSITSSHVSVTSLIFRQISTTNGSAVKIELTLTETRGNTSRSESFYNTVVLQGMYGS